MKTMEPGANQETHVQAFGRRPACYPRLSLGRAAALLIALALCCLAASLAQAAEPAADAPKQDMQQLTQKASNPVGDLWMLANQFNFNLIQSDKVKLFNNPQTQFNWNFQPIMPVDLSDAVRVIVRPIIPVFNAPYTTDGKNLNYASGLGDIGLQTIFAPNTDSMKGFMWGIGPTAIFPTASNEYVGKGKWQLGGAVAALYLDEKWVVGVYPQHWWSVAGDSSRSNVSFTNLQYFLWYSPWPTWQIGMAPNVLIDWTQNKAEDRLTLPIGFGISKLFRLGRLPIKVTAEVDYSVVRPNNIPSNEWTFRINFTPIIMKLF
jgi:hypothetical protein